MNALHSAHAVYLASPCAADSVALSGDHLHTRLTSAPHLTSLTSAPRLLRALLYVCREMESLIDAYHEPRPGYVPIEYSDMGVSSFSKQMMVNLRRNFVIYWRAPGGGWGWCWAQPSIARVATGGRQGV